MNRKLRKRARSALEKTETQHTTGEGIMARTMLCARSTSPMHNAKGPLRFQQANPKRPGSASYARYEQYKSALSYDVMLRLGGTPADFRHDWKSGFVAQASKPFIVQASKPARHVEQRGTSQAEKPRCSGRQTRRIATAEHGTMQLVSQHVARSARSLAAEEAATKAPPKASASIAVKKTAITKRASRDPGVLAQRAENERGSKQAALVAAAIAAARNAHCPYSRYHVGAAVLCAGATRTHARTHAHKMTHTHKQADTRACLHGRTSRARDRTRTRPHAHARTSTDGRTRARTRTMSGCTVHCLPMGFCALRRRNGRQWLQRRERVVRSLDLNVPAAPRRNASQRGATRCNTLRRFRTRARTLGWAF